MAETDSIPKGRINLEDAAVMVLAAASGMDLLTQMLHGFGIRQPYRRFTADEASQTCQEADLDLIVCDGAMAGGEAYDFVTDLRHSGSEPNRFCPVIILAGHTPLAQVAKARDCGANFVVAKPVTPRTLLERIVWIAQETRPFVELDGYIGPDRRFQNLGPPDPSKGRRRADMIVANPEAGARPLTDPARSLL
jgi:CheY-like chemotaxis protein